MRTNIAISSITYDPFGSRILPVLRDVTALRAGARRATRTATLDGGCVVYDTGYAVADRRHDVDLDAAHLAFIEHIVQTYRLVHVSTTDGFFVAIPTRYAGQGERVRLTLEYTEQIA